MNSAVEYESVSIASTFGTKENGEDIICLKSRCNKFICDKNKREQGSDAPQEGGNQILYCNNHSDKEPPKI